MSAAASGAVLRGALDYLLNCAWQAPLVALAAVALTTATRASLRGRCLAFAGGLVLVGLAPLVPTHLLSGPEPANLMASGVASGSRPMPTPALLAPVGSFLAEALVVAAGVAVAVAAIRLAAGWVTARRLVRRSRPLWLPEAAVDAMSDFLAASGRSVPRVRTCDGLAGPAVVGAWAPVVLVPPGFEALPHEQLVAALLHECAHVARRDYALNLLCETLALPSSWHPAAALLKRRFRAAREAACDQLAATALGSPTRYARCLVELARTVESGSRLSGPALQLLGRGELEDRVRRLTGPASGAARLSPIQTAAAVALTLGCIAPLTCLHLTPVLSDGRAAREVARVAVFDRAAPIRPTRVATARMSAAPAPRSSRPPPAHAVALAELHRPALVQLAQVQLAQAPMPPTPLASPVVVQPPIAMAASVAPDAPPVVALARLDEAADLGRLMFTVEIGTVSPCLPPPSQPAATAAAQPPTRSPADPTAASDFDPFAPTASPAATTASAAASATPAPAAPSCLKAAALRSARPPGLA